MCKQVALWFSVGAASFDLGGGAAFITSVVLKKCTYGGFTALPAKPL